MYVERYILEYIRHMHIISYWMHAGVIYKKIDSSRILY